MVVWGEEKVVANDEAVVPVVEVCVVGRVVSLVCHQAIVSGVLMLVLQVGQEDDL